MTLQELLKQKLEIILIENCTLEPKNHHRTSFKGVMVRIDIFSDFISDNELRDDNNSINLSQGVRKSVIKQFHALLDD